MHKSLRALREGRRTPGPGGAAAAAAAAAARYAGSARTINYLLIPSKKPVQVRPSGHTDAEPRPARCTRTHPHGRPRGRCFIDTYDGTLSGRSCFKPQRDLTEKRARARLHTRAVRCLRRSDRSSRVSPVRPSPSPSICGSGFHPFVRCREPAESSPASLEISGERSPSDLAISRKWTDEAARPEREPFRIAGSRSFGVIDN